ncbi:MAG: diguanylate cyclase [Alphaproteobacteria bacterium]|nr:diguanylate cyclase [Alphaproteobacteria bacterium]
MSAIKILSVEDDDDDADVLARALQCAPGREYELHRTHSLAEMPSAIAVAKPDLILLDLHLPDTRGADTVHGAMRYAADIPVLVLTGSGSEQIGQSSIDLGVQDFIPKAELFSAHLSRSIDYAIRRKQKQRDAERSAQRDPLTGLSNRAGLMQSLARAAARTRRQGGGFALAFLDLDGFKAINDNYGHAAGDEVLVTISKRARAIARTNDTLCRLGGDEFVFLLDGCFTRAKARQGASRFAAVICKPIVLSGEVEAPHVSVSASFGLAICPKDSLDPQELLSMADQAMYDSKRGKRGTPRSDQAQLWMKDLRRASLTRN